MNEFAIGQDSEINYISSFLSLVRAVKIERLFPHLWFETLDKYLVSEPALNRDLFFSCLEFMSPFLQRQLGPNFEFLPLSRWGVVVDAADTVGGFHSLHSGGYLDYYLFGLGAEPSRSRYPEDKTWEILRSYIHDSIHAACYRSYRMPRSINQNPRQAKYFLPEVYRYQYGINFRMQNGISFSAPISPNPEVLNLNLLMDGLGVLLQSQGMKSFASAERSFPIDENWELHRDIFGVPTKSDVAYPFYRSVVQPTASFLKEWSLDSRISLLGRAMVSGDMTELSSHLDSTWQTRDVFNKLFRQPRFEFEHRTDDVVLRINNPF